MVYILINNLAQILLCFKHLINFIKLKTKLILKEMGQSHDKNIDIYMETFKDIHMAGQFLDGAIYINCHSYSGYGQLNLRLVCNEQVNWTESHGQGRVVHYHNSAETYNQLISVCSFQEKNITPGQYTFPFKLLLPQGFPGSFSMGYRNFIRYKLSVQLVPSIPENKIQTYERVINIQQPLRAPFGIASKSFTQAPQCCGCCADYGIVKVELFCDKNQIKDKDQLKIKAMIDNSLGKADIKSVQFTLTERSVQVSSWGKVKYTDEHRQCLHALDKSVPVGFTQNISFVSEVPSNFSGNSTSIGRIIAKYFSVNANISLGCCSNADCSLHLVYHSSAPIIQEKKVEKAPVGWNPKIAPEAVLTGLNVYAYAPHESIPQHNRSNGNQLNVNFGINLKANNLQNMDSNYRLGE